MSERLKPRGLRGSDAELLARKWLESLGWLVHRAGKTSLKRITRPDGSPVLRRDGQPMVVNESHDVLGCFDLVAIRPAGVWLVQVTTQSGRTERRRKIEAIAAHLPTLEEVRVSILSHEATEDPANRARRKHHFRVEDFALEPCRACNHPGNIVTGMNANGRCLNCDGNRFTRAWGAAVAIEFSPSAVEAHAREAAAADPKAAARVERARATRARKQPCGHPLSAVEGTAKGSRWCGECEREKRAMPLFGEGRKKEP